MNHASRFVCTCLLAGCALSLSAQDEGAIVKRERIDKSKGIFLNFGPSFTLGKNIGDYSTGFNVELGFLKRLNRVLSVGPSVSYQSFMYDPEVTTAKSGDAYIGNGDPNGWRTKYAFPSLSYDYGYVLNLEGGDLSLTSLSVNVKLNFIPVKDNTKISAYGFVKPFVSISSRKAVHGSDKRYTYEIYEDNQNTASTADDILYYNLGDNTWYPDGYNSKWGPENYDALKSETKVTGGVFIGPGIEVMPTKSFSFFLQAAFGYTFPVSFVSTQSYAKTTTAYGDEKFPMVNKGFPSINVQLGASYNF
ncbi:hypothetical protein SAMN04488109_0616 [Chryseolinea serpens]|uniref:Outer membrane protein beta-barrel domain-containing protein n=1 Tax=Chryseolinea serpens TaxID=947013 RepID=A0A1M5KFP9_9BACT|nr:hypothetical protein [Chryseolinea serpens]SHG51561.1 hypothetical protein SAMN04488109_0616 [Chryseolinea serpens]